MTLRRRRRRPALRPSTAGPGRLLHVRVRTRTPMRRLLRLLRRLMIHAPGAVSALRHARHALIVHSPVHRAARLRVVQLRRLLRVLVRRLGGMGRLGRMRRPLPVLGHVVRC